MYEIRKYQPSDKERLRFICRETAGDYFKKSEKLLNAVSVVYSDYFTENEPENIFVVANDENIAVGYILCSTDSKKFFTQMQKKYAPIATRKSIGMLPVCLGYMLALRYEGKENSTHLHIDLLPECQRMGLGTRLIDTLRHYLAQKGIPNVAVNTIERSSSAYKFYKKYGFKENKHYFGGLVSLTISTR